MPTPTKPTTTPEPAPREEKEEAGPSKDLESESEPVPTPRSSRSPPHPTLEDMANTARRILIKNPEITQRMMEHLKPQVPLQTEQLPTSPKLVEDKLNIADVGNPSIRLSQ